MQSGRRGINARVSIKFENRVSDSAMSEAPSNSETTERLHINILLTFLLTSKSDQVSKVISESLGIVPETGILVRNRLSSSAAVIIFLEPSICPFNNNLLGRPLAIGSIWLLGSN